MHGPASFARAAGLILLGVLTTACMRSTRPADDSGFAPRASIAGLRGCFANRSDAVDGAPSKMLSRYVWGDRVRHEDIDAVGVVAGDADTLSVSAYAGRQRLRSDTFRLGQGFDFKDGVIELEPSTAVSAAGEPGNVFIGVASSRVRLGLDAQGNARSAEHLTVAGTAFLVIPVVGNVQDVGTFSTLEHGCGQD